MQEFSKQHIVRVLGQDVYLSRAYHTRAVGDALWRAQAPKKESEAIHYSLTGTGKLPRLANSTGSLKAMPAHSWLQADE